MRVRIQLAGDINHDGVVNSTDSGLWNQTWDKISASPATLVNNLPPEERRAADLTGDGQVTQADRQVMYANYGWKANQAPIQTAPTQLKTHTDLATAASLETVAQDLEGDGSFWRILGSTHGTASLSADGQTLLFMPEVGYAGAATITVQADDGFAVSAPMQLTVNVSGSRLLSIRIERIAALATGAAAQLKVFGDFEDEANVALTGNYAQYTSSDSSVLSVSNTGRVKALSDGLALVQVRARGIEGVNMFTVSVDGTGPELDIDGFELDTYPPAITLPTLIHIQ